MDRQEAAFRRRATLLPAMIVGLILAGLASTGPAQADQSTSQRSRGSGISGTQPFDSKWSRGGAEAERAVRSPRYDNWSQRCNDAAARIDGQRNGSCR